MICAAALAVSCLWIGRAQAALPTATEPSESAIRRILTERVDTTAGPDRGIGIVVGIVNAHGREIIAYHHSRLHDRARFTEDTVFEIGSVGKVFTALLLSDMVRSHELALADPAARYLPRCPLPEYEGEQISLVDLVTHTSGLPFFPDTYPTIRDAKEYTSRNLCDFLAQYKLTRTPGADWDYSNIGYWVLGQALATRAFVPLDELLQQRIFAPLKMSSTGAELSDQMRARLVQGYDASLHPAPPFDAFSVYKTFGAAAGGVYSSVNDLLIFLAATLELKASPLTPAMDAMTKTRRPIDDEDQQALGWVVERKGTNEYYLHDGGTWGYASAVAWDPKKRMGVVVLSNQQQEVTDIARHLLQPDIPLASPSSWKHHEIPMPAVALDHYPGVYAAEHIGVFKITRRGNQLILALPMGWGVPKFRLRAEDDERFFVAEMPISVTFQRDEKRDRTSALIYPPRGQRGIQAIKTDVQPR